MSFIQAPISRHLSGNTQMAGKTTMIPQTATAYMNIPIQQKYDYERQNLFRFHALAPRTVQTQLGMRGDVENGNRFEVGGSPNIRYGYLTSFGTPSTQRSFAENIDNTLAADSKVLGRGLFKTKAFHETGRDLKGKGGRGGRFRG